MCFTNMSSRDGKGYVVPNRHIAARRETGNRAAMNGKREAPAEASCAFITEGLGKSSTRVHLA
jgi:hypothetical protein